MYGPVHYQYERDICFVQQGCALHCFNVGSHFRAKATLVRGHHMASLKTRHTFSARKTTVSLCHWRGSFPIISRALLLLNLPPTMLYKAWHSKMPILTVLCQHYKVWDSKIPTVTVLCQHYKVRDSKIPTVTVNTTVNTRVT